MKITLTDILPILVFLLIGYLLSRGNRRRGIYYATLTPFLIMSYDLMLAIYIVKYTLWPKVLLQLILACLFGFIGGWLGRLPLHKRIGPNADL